MEGMNTAKGPEARRKERTLLRELFERDLEPPLQVMLLCECGERSCAAPIVATVPEYAEVRSDPTLLIVAPGHRPDRSECVRENHEYLVVRPDDALAARGSMQPAPPRRPREPELHGTTPAAGSRASGMEPQWRLAVIRDVLEREGQALARDHDDRLLTVLATMDELKLSIARALIQLRYRR
jgi:hypothetical protein